MGIELHNKIKIHYNIDEKLVVSLMAKINKLTETDQAFQTLPPGTPLDSCFRQK